MRYQRNAHRGSRYAGFGHPRATTHTAESYQAKYKGQRQGTNYLFRIARLRRREARQ